MIVDLDPLAGLMEMQNHEWSLLRGQCPSLALLLGVLIQLSLPCSQFLYPSSSWGRTSQSQLLATVATRDRGSVLAHPIFISC